MIDKIQLCVTLIILSRHAHLRGDEKACEVYGDVMKHLIRKHNITVFDCTKAMLQAFGPPPLRIEEEEQEVDAGWSKHV